MVSIASLGGKILLNVIAKFHDRNNNSTTTLFRRKKTNNTGRTQFCGLRKAVGSSNNYVHTIIILNYLKFYDFGKTVVSQTVTFSLELCFVVS